MFICLITYTHILYIHIYTPKESKAQCIQEETSNPQAMS